MGKGTEIERDGGAVVVKAKEMEKLKEKEEILSSSFFVFSFAFSSLWLYSNTGLVVLGVVVG